MSSTIGKDCLAYLNTGTHETPVWVAIPRAKDVTVSPSKGQVDLSCRQSPWKKNGGGLKTLDASFGYLAKTGSDTVHDDILDSFLNDTPVEFAFMDGDIETAGSKGWRAFFVVFGLEEDQAMEAGVSYSVSISHAEVEEESAIVDPDFYEVSEET